MIISRRRLWIALVGLLAFSVLRPSALRANTKFLNVQGKLTDTSGNPLTGTQTVTFRLYTSSTAAVASAFWSESQSVTLSTGLFNVALGSVTALDSTAFNQIYYLGIQVAGDANELSPRQQLGASAYAQGSVGAFNAGGSLIAGSNAVVLGTMTVQGNAFSVGGSTLVATGGNVGVGTASPASALDVNGAAQFGQGATKSTFTATGALALASGGAITQAGSGGYITNSSSVNASAFFGDGAHLTNVAGVLSGGTSGYSTRWTGTASAGLGTFSDTGSSATVVSGNTLLVDTGGNLTLNQGATVTGGIWRIANASGTSGAAFSATIASTQTYELQYAFEMSSGAALANPFICTFNNDASAAYSNNGLGVNQNGSAFIGASVGYPHTGMYLCQPANGNFGSTDICSGKIVIRSAWQFPKFGQWSGTFAATFAAQVATAGGFVSGDYKGSAVISSIQCYAVAGVGGQMDLQLYQLGR